MGVANEDEADFERISKFFLLSGQWPRDAPVAAIDDGPNEKDPSAGLPLRR